jgi:hypothetical protein
MLALHGVRAVPKTERSTVMRTLTKLAAACLAALALLALPAHTHAAGATRTVTEDQINESYWVTNPPARGVSDRSVDLQPGQVVVSETWTRRAAAPRQVVATIIPTINNGRVFWTVASATIDGAPASDELLAQINARINSSWRNYAKRQAGAGRVAAVTISDDAITYTLQTK